MDEYKRFLSDRLLSEERPVTYRLLSRALDVHTNTAKEMLYDYHKTQNAERASSVHATYLVYGTRTLVKAETGDDVKMGDSVPEKDAASEDIATTTLTLAREEELTDILAQYQQVTSIHVYSLAPHPQRNLSLLAEINAQLSEYPVIEDISAAAKKYGTIPNPQVQRRDRKSRPQIVAPESKPVKKEPVKKETVVPKFAFAPKVKQEATASKQSTTDSKAPTKAAKEEPSEPSSSKEAPSSSAAKKGPATKKGGIMQSFAKAAAKPPKPKPTPKKEEEDTAMALSDDGEADDGDLPSKKPAADSDAIKKARQEREEALRRMMDEEDEDDAEASEKEEEPADEEMEEAPEPESEPEPKKEDTEPAEVVSSSGNGRRRGKRRVMKKKRILDDQGYMVTIQEPGWESFSEDEAPPPAKKPALTSTQSQSSTPSSSAGKAKKAAPKGQGNIMSFFSKK